MKTDVKRLSKERKNPNKEVLTTDQVAMLLQMKPVAVRNAVRAGTIPCLKVGNRLRFSRKAILEALDVRKK